MKNNRKYDQVGLLVQAVISVFLLASTVLAFFEPTFLTLTESLITIMMFVMAYNNHKIYKRKGLTYAYIVVGIFMLVLSIVSVVN